MALMEDRPRCTAHSSRSGERCRKEPVKGLNVCRTHGGSAPQSKAAAVQRVNLANAKKTAAQLVVAYEGVVDSDPLSALMRMLRTSAMAERAYAALLEQTGDILTAVDYGKAGGVREEPHPYLKLWNEERDRLAKFSKAAIDAGIESKRLELERDQAMMTAQILIEVISALNISVEEKMRARELMADRFRALGAAA